MGDEDERHDDRQPDEAVQHEQLGPGTTAGGGAVRSGRRDEPDGDEDGEDGD
jgi:hypothetical protein